MDTEPLQEQAGAMPVDQPPPEDTAVCGGEQQLSAPPVQLPSDATNDEEDQAQQALKTITTSDLTQLLERLQKLEAIHAQSGQET